MFTLFKGEMTLDDILNGLPYRMLIELRDTRIDRMKREHEEMEKEAKRREKAKIRGQIMA